MTAQEVAKTILSHWRLEHTPFEIARALTLAGIPMSQDGVLKVVRRYCDVCSENKSYRAK